MHTLTKSVLAAAAFLTLASPSFAVERGEVGVNLGLSTLGITPQLTYGLGESFKVRGVYGFVPSFNNTSNIEGINYDVSAEHGGMGLIADYHIGGSGFHLSGGVMAMSTNITAFGPRRWQQCDYNRGRGIFWYIGWD